MSVEKGGTRLYQRDIITFEWQSPQERLSTSAKALDVPESPCMVEPESASALALTGRASRIAMTAGISTAATMAPPLRVLLTGTSLSRQASSP
jgi:hypothetical protein